VWIVPVVAVAGGVVLLIGAFRRRKVESATREVTDEDAARVAAALRERAE
jgi:cytochrome c-type biogenesis protein CcmH/NrfF